MNDQQNPTVGFIGAGRMGLPMVRRLADAGISVVAVGRRAETAAALRELGVTVLDAPAAVGAAAQVLCAAGGRCRGAGRAARS